jgi:hypothetical protein
MDELFASDLKLAYIAGNNFLFEIGDETEVSKVQRNLVNCPNFQVCLDWAKYHKNVSILVNDMFAEIHYATGTMIGENSEPLICRLEDGVVYTTGLTMILFHGDPLLRQVSEIIDHVVEAGIYNKWISQFLSNRKLISRKIAIIRPLDEYYSFNLYHIQPAFDLLLMGWCLRAFCLMVEVFYTRVLSNRLRSC